MKFFIVAIALVGAVLADETTVDPVQQARSMMAQRILTGNPADFRDCRSGIAACAEKPNWVCNEMMKLCSPKNAPKLEQFEGTCDHTSSNHKQCKPLYRCNKVDKCAFVGPKACENDGECNANVEGLNFVCTELPKNAPGKRCWMKCNNNDDCHGCTGGDCRIPEQFRKQISCCEGMCQRKTVCA